MPRVYGCRVWVHDVQKPMCQGPEETWGIAVVSGIRKIGHHRSFTNGYMTRRRKYEARYEFLDDHEILEECPSLMSTSVLGVGQSDSDACRDGEPEETRSR